MNDTRGMIDPSTVIARDADGIAHMDRVAALLGQPIIALTNGTLASQIEDNHMLPNVFARWCTRLLKLRPFGKFLAEVAPAVSYVGLRADEDEREGTRPGGDSAALGTVVLQRFPMREWGWNIEDVYRFLETRRIEIPERTDCARCPYQRLGEWFMLWRNHPEIYLSAEADEARWGHTYRSAQRDTWPAALKDLRARFEAGARPEVSLRMMEKRRDMCRRCSL